jgi:hypothetical protein
LTTVLIVPVSLLLFMIFFICRIGRARVRCVKPYLIRSSWDALGR